MTFAPALATQSVTFGSGSSMRQGSPGEDSDAQPSDRGACRHNLNARHKAFTQERGIWHETAASAQQSRQRGGAGASAFLAHQCGPAVAARQSMRLLLPGRSVLSDPGVYAGHASDDVFQGNETIGLKGIITAHEPGPPPPRNDAMNGHAPRVAVQRRQTSPARGKLPFIGTMVSTSSSRIQGSC